MCGKVVFRSSTDAHARAAKMRGHGERMSVYRGPCGNWHLATDKAERRIRELVRSGVRLV